MTCFVEKDGEIKEIQTEDLAIYNRRGWVKTEKKVEPALIIKRGKKRLETEEE